MVNFFDIPNRRWNGKTLWRRSGSEDTHLNPRSPRPKEKNKEIFKEIQTDLLQAYFKTHRCTVVKLEMTSGPFQATPFTVITLNPERQTVRAERRNISYSAEVHRRYQNNIYRALHRIGTFSLVCVVAKVPIATHPFFL